MDQKNVVEPVEATKDDLLVVATSTGYKQHSHLLSY